MSQRKRRGHWCWCCQRVLPNERFSGNGRGRHVCNACSKLDAGEKRYRQALADLDRARRHTFPFVHKSRRKWFDQLASSPDARVRKLHSEATSQMNAERRQRRRIREEDERALEENEARLADGDL